MRLLYLSGHSILEFDTLSLFAELGYDLFSLGSYIDPTRPHDPKRPALPQIMIKPDLILEVTKLAEGKLAGFDSLTAARTHLPDALIDWAEIIISDAYPEEWLAANWERIKHKRVIWRTIGQSNPKQELHIKDLHDQGLQIVRYSPAEKRLFTLLESFAGEDALIRFHKDPEEWTGWTGERAEVGNVSQHNPKPHERDAFLNWSFWEEATNGLPNSFAGVNSELIGGLGNLPYDEMRRYLRGLRAYLYTGTQPASYTLGFIEAMMTGVPIVSIGKNRMWSPLLFEADELVPWASDDPNLAHGLLRGLLEISGDEASKQTRQIALGLFGKDKIKEQWRDFLA